MNSRSNSPSRRAHTGDGENWLRDIPGSRIDDPFATGSSSSDSNQAPVTSDWPLRAHRDQQATDDGQRDDSAPPPSPPWPYLRNHGQHYAKSRRDKHGDSEFDASRASAYMQGLDQYLDHLDRHIARATSQSQTSHWSDRSRHSCRPDIQSRDTNPARKAINVDGDAADTSIDTDLSRIPLPIPEPYTDKKNKTHRRNRQTRTEWTQKDIEDAEDLDLRLNDPREPARVLKPSEITLQRCFFFTLVIILNAGALVAALLTSGHVWVLGFILFIKAKDCISVIVIVVSLIYRKFYYMRWPEPDVAPQWILSCIPTYSETEEQIVKTIFSLRNNDVDPHKQVICVIIDGKPRAIRSHLTHVAMSFHRPYLTSKYKQGHLTLDAGFIEDIPVIIIEKIRNAGKKDSLILCHDLFNHPRDDMPIHSKLLRNEVWHSILPVLTHGLHFTRFDMILCTDADSSLHKGAVKALADGLVRTPNGIAVCGLVLVEFGIGDKWSFWNIYQQYQYTFGQYIRRQAESVWGKVTCLPGCVTMIAVRVEMAGAIQKYAAPVTSYPVLRHQVQYLGTDRRLTYCMLSQSKSLRTALIQEAMSETVAPMSLKHFLSQRRRWGSNAYFNNMFYCFGKRMILITRVAALTELVRLTMVYYRLANTIMFFYGLATAFRFIQILPLIIVTSIPILWYVINTLFLEPEMRKRWLKLAIGFIINKCIAPFVSIIVFTKVATSLGSQVWGVTGGNDNAGSVTGEVTEAVGPRDGAVQSSQHREAPGTE